MNYNYLTEFEKLAEPYLPFIGQKDVNIQIKNCSDYIKYLFLKKLTNNGTFINHSYTFNDTGNPKCKEVIINFKVCDSFYYFNIPNNHEFIREYIQGIKKYLSISNLDTAKNIILNVLDETNLNILIKDSTNYFIIFYDKNLSFYPFCNCNRMTIDEKNRIFKTFFNRELTPDETIYFNFNDEIEFLFLYIKILIKNPSFIINDPIINIIKDAINFKNYKDLRDKIQKIFIYNIDISKIFKLVHILEPKLDYSIIKDECYINSNYNKKRKGTYYLEYFFVRLKKELSNST
jgi:hypothetical protein